MKTEDEKPKQAVALNYDFSSSPKVVAKGSGETAEKIIELAEQHDVPLYQDPELTGLLSELKLNQEIPETLFLAVAKVLSFIYRLEGIELD